MAIVGSRPGEDHMRIVARVMIRIARDRLRLMDGGFRRLRRIEQPQSLVRRPARGVEMDRDIDAVVLDALEAADRLAEDDARARVFDGEVENLLTASHL